MSASQTEDTADEPVYDLSLQEAARLYVVSVRTLTNRVRWGQLDAYKAHGARGLEWRVSRHALETSGYQPRVEQDRGDEERDARMMSLERELAEARRVAAAERRRADEADRRLGQVMLECGRLRAALAAAQAATRPT